MIRDHQAGVARHWAEQRQQQREAAAEQKGQVIGAMEAELARRGLFPGGALEVAA